MALSQNRLFYRAVYPRGPDHPLEDRLSPAGKLGSMMRVKIDQVSQEGA